MDGGRKQKKCGKCVQIQNKFLILQPDKKNLKVYYYIIQKIMCRFSMSFNDAVVDEMRPLFTDEKALLMWMQAEMERMMREYAARFRKKPATNGAELLRKLQSIPNTPEGFLQLDSVLSPSRSSIEELREEAYLEKYGI